MKKVLCAVMLGFMSMVACLGSDKSAKAAEVGVYTLSDTEENVVCDVTGDGVVDTVSFEKILVEDDLYKGYRVIVNGNIALEKISSEEFFYELDPVYIQTKNRGYLFVSSVFVNDDGSRYIYEYVNGTFEQRMNLLETVGKVYYHDTVQVLSATKNQINLKVTGQSYLLAGATMKLSLKVNADGTLALKDKVVKITYSKKRWNVDVSDEPYNAKYLETTKKVSVYKNATGSKKAFTMKKGTKLKISKVSFQGKTPRYYCITKSGKKGWIASKYAIFKDLMYAG